MRIKNLIVVLLVLCQNVGAQHANFKFPDSLSGKTFDYFESHITLNPADSERSLLYARCWLLKSKSETNYGQMALAYKAMMYNAKKDLHLQYADSMVQAAQRTSDNLLLGSAFMTKGIVCYERKEIMKALDNYLIADEYISKTNDGYLIHKVKYGIGLTKYYIGFYNEAIALFKQCTDYFEEENERAYLNSLHMLGLCYNRVQNYDLCTSTNEQGIAAGRELGDLEMESYFIHSEGVNQYFKHNYRESIDKLLQAMPVIERNKDFANESIANFYIAKSYLALKQKVRALPYLKKVDDAFQKEKYIRPDLRESYELLIGNYHANGDQASELLYINRLLKVDSVLHNNYRYLLAKVVKQYDTKKLLSAKAEIERSMQTRTVVGFTIISLLVLIVAFLLYRHFANKRKYRQKYEELMNRKPEIRPALSSEKDIDPVMSSEVEKVVLKNLDKFEANKKFLEKGMDLVRLAELLHTNTKYVTKIIQLHRGKGTIEYISDLRIDHIVELLKTDNRFRNYTNKALGEEVGFGSTQNFTRAFKARNVISPTYFIQELKKDLQE
ncbi:helix-turn-helix domain-containing protein [Flavobacterium sp.]|uniref:helix-turn-helix domain-containing protein n=1 Tax=Flavobacterium sp. TaxID=239 RepID=UPI002632C93D|nr:helix-turn-helix domain-containing protein [Flavobacterium sp.]